MIGISEIIFFLKRQYHKYIAIPLAQRKLKDLSILSSEDSIKFILGRKCSVSRFGDGEFDVLLGRNGNTFQIADEMLAKRLKEVLTADDVPNHYVGIPIPLVDTSLLRASSKDFWGFYTLYNVDFLKPYLSSKRVYLDTQLSRFYIIYKNKSRCTHHLELLRQIWNKKDILIVEGKLSRTGVGNDLYSNANSIKRILGCSTNAFERYDEMFESIKRYATKEQLILLSYGMCATVLAYDLAKLGYWAIDIGHLDIEYEWFLQQVESETPIIAKFTNDAGEYGRNNISVCEDSDYLSQILCDITI